MHVFIKMGIIIQSKYLTTHFFVNSSILLLFQEKERRSQSPCKMPLAPLKTHAVDLASMGLSLAASQRAISTLWAPKKVRSNHQP